MADGILAAVNENGNIDRFIDTKGGVHYIEPKRYEESVAKIDAAATKAKETVNSATEAVSECKAQTGACTQETARAKEIADTVESRITGIEGDVAALRDSVSHYKDQYGWYIVEIGGAKICAYSYDIALFAGGNEYVRFTEVPLPDGLFTEAPHAVVCKKQTRNSIVEVSVNMNVSSVSTDSVHISINNGSGGIPDNVRMPFTLLVIGW